MQRFLRVFLPVMLLSSAALAQVAGSGAITGMIQDNYGEGLPDATVVLSNPDLGTLRTLFTTVDGEFDAAGLLPADGYSLAVTRKGFADWKLENFRITTGQKLRFTVSLKAATEAEAKGESKTEAKAEPQAEAKPESQAAEPKQESKSESAAVSERMDDLSAGFSSAATREQIESLPLSGRRWYSAALLQPLTSAGGTSAPIAIVGLPYANAFLVDGMDVGQRFYRNSERQPIVLPQDAVEEVAVTRHPVAESGRAMGGTVDVVTRNEYNNIHGSLYEYYRNPSLNASDRYSLGRDLRQNRHQAGASLGGPLVPDRLFYFANIEGLDGRSDTLNNITNPLITDKTGTSIVTLNCKALLAQCANAYKIIQNQMNVIVERPVHSVSGLGKLDFRGERQTFNFAADLTKWKSRNGLRSDLVSTDGGLLGANGDAVQNSRFAKAGWTALLGDFTSNEMRLGWTQNRFSESSPDRSPLSTGPVAINLAGANLGASTAAPGSFNEQRYQFSETLAFSLGGHSVRFGGDFSRTMDRVNQMLNATGTYTYPSLTAFALDLAGNNGRNYTWFTQSLGDAYRNWHSTEVAVFAQDTWRLLPNLTVDIGLRYEKPFLPLPVYGNTDYYETAKISSPSADFAPRVGLAYSLGDRTTLRFGYGWYYAPFSGELLDKFYGGGQLNVSLSSAQAGAKTFPYTISAIKSIPAGSKNLFMAANKVRNPYAKQTNLTLERRLGASATLTASYVRSSGVKLWSVKDLNLMDTEDTATYTILDAAGNSTGTYTTPYWTKRADPRYAHLYEVRNGASSWYNALALQYRQRMWRGVTFQGSYTWSHALDNAGAFGQLGFGVANTFNENLQNDKGTSSSDQRHRASFNWIWQPELGSGAPSLARKLVNGWELSGILTLASGQPATATVLVSGTQFSTLTPAYAGSLNGSGGWDRVPFLNVNSLLTGSRHSLDARITRSFKLGEAIKASLFAEAFNAFNAQYDTRVNTLGYVATGGVLKPLAGFGEGNSTATYPEGTNARRVQLGIRVTF